jgi:hypothetical protein
VLMFQHLHHRSAELSVVMLGCAGGTLSADYVTDTDARCSALYGSGLQCNERRLWCIDLEHLLLHWIVHGGAGG